MDDPYCLMVEFGYQGAPYGNGYSSNAMSTRSYPVLYPSQSPGLLSAYGPSPANQAANQLRYQAGVRGAVNSLSPPQFPRLNLGQPGRTYQIESFYSGQGLSNFSSFQGLLLPRGNSQYSPWAGPQDGPFNPFGFNAHAGANIWNGGEYASGTWGPFGPYSVNSNFLR